MIDPRTPVIVGVGQVTQRPADVPDVRHAAEPVDLMAEAARRADTDAGGRRSLIDRLDAVFVAQPLSRRYPDPGLLVARRLGRDDVHSVRALVGGNSPQFMVNEAAAAISRGELDVAVVTGAEAQYSRVRARREGVELDWERSEVAPCPHEIGDSRPGSSEDEAAHHANLPIHVYPLFETALRAAQGRDVAAHQRATGELWARLSAVAAANPLAWSQERFGPAEIVTPSAGNRLVTFPYTKRMCANLTVDQGAAVLVTSYGAARAAGVPDDGLIFPLAGADAHDHFLVTERRSLAESPGLRFAADDALRAAGVGVDDVARFDLYSCFPSAVQVALRELGLGAGDERPISQTGGLALFGGPGNSYVTHSIAEMVQACRRDPGSVGLVTGVGWYLTKHSVGLYSTVPPDGGFRRVDPEATQARVNALPSRDPAGAVAGDLVIEATAVAHGRDGDPEFALVAGLTPSGQRALSLSADPAVMASMTQEPWEGRTVTVTTDGATNRLAV